MSLIYQLAKRGRGGDRLAAFGLRRAVLGRLAAARRAAGPAADGRFAGLPEAAAVPPFWRPARQPALDRFPALAREVRGAHGLVASAHWPIWAKNLDAAESEMLGLVYRRAEVEAGHHVLVVGAGAMGTTHHLRDEIGPERLAVWEPGATPAAGSGIELLADGPVAPEPGAGFDRVLVLEGLPSRADPAAALAALGRTLRPGGKLFLQLACHRRYAYALSPGEGRWLDLEPALVPATDLVPRLATGLETVGHWELSGEHYERTFRAWRRRLESRRGVVEETLAGELGSGPVRRLTRGWRLALLARERMFGLRGGQEWWISHYLLHRTQP